MLYSGVFRVETEVVLRDMVSVAPSVPRASRKEWEAEAVGGRWDEDCGLRGGISPGGEVISKHDGHWKCRGMVQ